jgi:hypothetical protein
MSRNLSINDHMKSRHAGIPDRLRDVLEREGRLSEQWTCQ